MEFGFRNVTFLKKTQLHFPCPPFPYFRASNLGKIDANFSGEILTSSAVLDHRDIHARVHSVGSSTGIHSCSTRVDSYLLVFYSS